MRQIYHGRWAYLCLSIFKACETKIKIQIIVHGILATSPLYFPFTQVQNIKALSTLMLRTKVN